MDQNTPARFFAAFNDIEQFLRQAINAKNSDSFWWIVDRAHEKHMLNKRQTEMLKDFGNLRNAIAHGRYYDDEPLASPHPRVVEQLEKLRELLTSPPNALAVLGSSEVVTLEADADIRQALKLIAHKGYSQIPVYSGENYANLLTTNVVARWIAADLADDNHVTSVAVGKVLEYAEAGDRAAFLPRTATAQEALDALTELAKDGTHPCALIFTEDGAKNKRPLGIATPTDLAVLVDALEWE
ncbi:CBS domain-containing protein [Corynebacterium striatum]|uniref:CBS domain-containing protein n=1 Tax=Corynebacterium striatum TaxID=43770 RepID=UPI003701024B